MRCVVLVLTLLVGTSSVRAQDLVNDLTMPAWTYCVPDMACFDFEGVQRLLVIQAAAQRGARLEGLQLELHTRMSTLVTTLEASQVAYAALQETLVTRTTQLTEQLAEARSEAEKYRGRVERRRIWPWVTLGLGLIAGVVVGATAGR